MSQLNGIWPHIGEFGRFQKRVYVLLNFLTVFHCCQRFLLVFVADKPQWKCSENELSYLGEEAKNHGYPCYKNGTMCRNVTFDNEFTSIVTEWKLVCDQEYKTNIAQAIIMAGSMLGAIVLSRVPDRHGRMFALIFMESLGVAFCFVSGFVQSYEQFVILRFLGAAMLTEAGMTIFVLISEIIGPEYSHRDQFLTVHQAFFSFGFVVLTGLAYYVRDWRNLCVIVSLPGLLCAVFCLRDICESPQWLLENGRLEECKELLRKIAKKNGFEPPEKSLHELTIGDSEKNPKVTQSLMDILGTEGYLKKITILASLWFCISMLYYGLSFASKSISAGNKYMNFCLSGLVEMPSLIVSVFLMKAGRQLPLFYLCVIAALSCFVCCWSLNEDQSQAGSYVVTSFAMFGKFGVAASYNMVYIFSAEIFTTRVRSFSMGICSTAASTGAIMAPLVVGLGVYDKRLPMLVFGIGGVFSAVLAITLPETLDVHVQSQELDKKKD